MTPRVMSVPLVAFVLATASALGVFLAAQTVSASQEGFTVASVKPCPPPTLAQTEGKFVFDAVRPVGLRLERGRVTFMCVTPASVIHAAYNGGHYGHQNAVARDVRGGPDWIRSELYTIELGGAEGVPQQDLLGPRLRSFLENRFQLRVHRTVDDEAMYALKVARGGLKIKPLSASDCVVSSTAVSPDPPQTQGTRPQVPCGTFKTSMNGTLRVMESAPVTMSAVASLFDLDRHILDKTGVKDRFAMHLEIETDPSIAPAAAFLKALEEQLGLTLVSTKGKRSWVQVERIERPR